jgi:hypothetical protein
MKEKTAQTLTIIVRQKMVSHLVDSDDRSQMTTIKGTLQYLENCMRLAELHGKDKRRRRDIFFANIRLAVIRHDFYAVSKCFRF